MDSIEINYSNPLTEVNDNYIIITPSYNEEITDKISEFIDHKNNINHLCGFVGSGNKNFDKEFCFNAKDLSKKYNKPLIFEFEFSGTNDDINEFKKEVFKYWNLQS